MLGNFYCAILIYLVNLYCINLSDIYVYSYWMFTLLIYEKYLMLFISFYFILYIFRLRGENSFSIVFGKYLADFVRLPLERSGGMMNLIDIYCLFNRARGTGFV